VPEVAQESCTNHDAHKSTVCGPALSFSSPHQDRTNGLRPHTYFSFLLLLCSAVDFQLGDSSHHLLGEVIEVGSLLPFCLLACCSCYSRRGCRPVMGQWAMVVMAIGQRGQVRSGRRCSCAIKVCMHMSVNRIRTVRSSCGRRRRHMRSWAVRAQRLVCSGHRSCPSTRGWSRSLGSSVRSFAATMED
jgi:hypothetical protein